MAVPRETYTEEGWKALGQAAKAYNLCVAGGDPKMIELARGVFGFVLERVSRRCVRTISD